ncbi:hypothetical protein F2P58_23485 [Vibrio fortis]|uniref:Uncharacterized protein n=1 Tax=Vibrio fortis TaxID=212667 RepID=A0A5N3QTF5_9VIBR|nr:hypothetical protein [Vibrio fortis]KAB0285476.1 hypothetical protein F2P58_23485 [Vibrio fortis]
MYNEYEPHVLGEVCTVYFSKDNPSEYQVFPEPTDLENWYVYQTTDTRELNGKSYDPSTGGLVDTLVPRETIQALRSEAYKNEADHLYMDAQYDIRTGKKTEDEAYKPWLEKVAEIKSRFPFND